MVTSSSQFCQIVRAMPLAWCSLRCFLPIAIALPVPRAVGFVLALPIELLDHLAPCRRTLGFSSVLTVA